jgi:hypothetical protein
VKLNTFRKPRNGDDLYPSHSTREKCEKANGLAAEQRGDRYAWGPLTGRNRRPPALPHAVAMSSQADIEVRCPTTTPKKELVPDTGVH